MKTKWEAKYGCKVIASRKQIKATGITKPRLKGISTNNTGVIIGAVVGSSIARNLIK